MNIIVKTYCYEIDRELEQRFMDAFNHGDADQVRRWATPLLRSIYTGVPKLHIPNDHEIRRWEDAATYELSRTNKYGEWRR